MVTFRYHTTQTLNFVEKAAAQMVDQDYQLLIKLFSNLRIDNRIFFPPNPPDPDPSSLNISIYPGDHLNLDMNSVECRRKPKTKAIRNSASGRCMLQAREKNKRLYRQIQRQDCNGSIPLTTFTLFSKLPPELRVKIWRYSFVGRTIVSESFRQMGRENDFSKNWVRTPNPVQLLINSESRTEVKRQYKFYKNWTAYWWYRDKYGYKHLTNLFGSLRELHLPDLGTYYHPKIDEFSLHIDVDPSLSGDSIYRVIATSVVCRSFQYGLESDTFKYIETLVIREASWTTYDSYHYLRQQPTLFKFAYPSFHHLREIVIYPNGPKVRREDNLLYTEVGRKQCLDFLKELFKQAQRKNQQDKIRVPVFKIYRQDTSTFFVG